MSGSKHAGPTKGDEVDGAEIEAPPFSSIQLHKFTLQSCSLNVPKEPNLKEVPAISISGRYNCLRDDKEKWMVHLCFFLGNGDDQVNAEIHATGQFLVGFDMSDFEASKKLISVNAAGVVYSEMRSLVFDLTARTDVGPLRLPLIDFRKIDLTDKTEDDDSIDAI